MSSFKNAKHFNCVVNMSVYAQHIPDPIDLSCWKARLNKLVTELWYSHKHTMQVLNWRFSLSRLLSSRYKDVFALVLQLLKVIGAYRGKPFHDKKVFAMCCQFIFHEVFSVADFICAVDKSWYPGYFSWPRREARYMCVLTSVSRFSVNIRVPEEWTWMSRKWMSLSLNSSIVNWMLGWNELNLDSMLVKSEGLVCH
jgi:hypothetical protein